MSESNVRKVVTTSLRRRVLRFCYWEGCFWAVMLGIAENFGLFYAVKRGVSPREVAVLTTVPMFLGAIANWLSPWIFRQNAFLKSGILITIGIQIAGLGCLVVAALADNYVMWIFWGLSLYWMGALAVSPLWLDWMTGWLPQERFGRFYSRRASTLALVTLVSFLMTSFLVARGSSMQIFFVIFLVALVARIVSFFLLALQSSPPARREVSVSDASKPRLWSWTSIVLFVAAAAVFKFVVNLSSAFFLPYMVKELNLSVLDIALVNGAAYVGIMMMVASFAEAMRRFHPMIGFQAMMLLAAANCFVWVWVTDLFSISILQFTSGFTWAVFDLACILIFQANFPGRARTILGLHMGLSGIATIGGGLVGSRLLESGMTYRQLFLVSAEWRLLIAGGFMVLALFFWKDFVVTAKGFRGFVRIAFWPRIALVSEIQRLLPLWRRRP